MVRSPCVPSMVAVLLSLPAVAQAQNLVVDNTTITLGGVRSYGTVQVINGGRIVVPAYNNSDKVNTGNLQIVADSITVDATSEIVADGRGYQPRLCNHGLGATSSAGGRGGCAVLDSGGGGAHFGRGGRGTKDCFCFGNTQSCQFPQEFEESCGYRSGNTCVSTGGAPVGTCPAIGGSCYNNDGLPSVAGVAFWHSIYEPEFGAAGGDKGCRDGWDDCRVSGAGGGRIVLAAVNASHSGSLTINGRVSAEGHRGCGSGNDSGGGGAGGSLLLVGDQVTVGSGAYVSAAGGLGGDTNAKQPGSTCLSCAQNPGGTCDDCGGGGGGGIISVLSGAPASLASTSVFNVAGADGGTCTICKGEAGGGAGELQLNGVYVGEFCDGFDNDFDGLIDEGLGSVTCGSGACQQSVAQCNTTNPADVFPNDCIPLSTASCQPPLTDNRSRFLVIVDTSGSMLTDLGGNYTFGDGSAGHQGLDTDNNGSTDDSRLYKAKQALTKVISAYPEIDFGMARFAQGVDTNVNCQLAHWFECAGLCCTYDNPANNSGGTPPTGPCVFMGAYGMIVVQPTSPGDECINYAGSCGQPRRGADVLVGFEKPIGQLLMWLDHKETNFIKDTTEGDHCNYGGGGDCELRGTGPTPLAGSLFAAKAYLAAAKAEDQVAFCRKYAVILLTDGSETCQGAPATAAAELLTLGVETYVVGFSVLAQEQAQLNAIANAGSTSGTRNAFFVGDENQLAAALASIVADSVVFEKCNALDDDCDLLIDEDFPQLGQPCNNGKLGACYKTGKYICKADGSGVVCDAPDAQGTQEICNGIDDDCDGQIDEIPGCIPCVPQPEICNNLDDDCDGQIDEGIGSVACGKDIGECKPGQTKCVGGKLICDGGTGPTAEQCNGLDDDCDGMRDGMSEQCYTFPTGCTFSASSGWLCTGFCKPGLRICTAQQTGGVWTGVWGACQGEIGPSKELCNGLDDDCDGEVDEDAECPEGSKCINGACTLPCSAGEFICPKGQICKEGWCIPDPCDPTQCPEGWICKGGQCVDPCANVVCDKYEKCVKGACVDTSCYNPANKCPAGEICVQGECVPDPCAEKTCGVDELCTEGVCVKLCSAITCPSGQLCKVVDGDDGKPVATCVEDPCARQQCGEGWVCKDGVCVEDPCIAVHCDKGLICDPETVTCVPDPCEQIVCPDSHTCVKGSCIADAELQSDQLLAAGGGGCACHLASGTVTVPAPLLLLLPLWLLLRERRRRRSSGEVQR